MYENRFVDNLPSTEDTHYCELGQRRINAAVNVFPDPPHRGAAWGFTTGLFGAFLFVQAPGVWGFSQVLSPD